MKTWVKIVFVFIFWFALMMISYAFFDDLHIEKTLRDYLFMPIPSFFFATLLTGFSYLIVVSGREN